MKTFRTVAYAEGFSFLLLLGIAMPLKYLAGIPEAVRIVGSIHGLLFLAYVFMAFRIGDREGWPPRLLGGAVLAAVLPFGPFVFDRKISERRKS